MNLAFSPEELAFRDEVRAFIAQRLPDDIRRKVQAGDPLVKDDYARWHRILFERGWAAPNWPQRYGGTGWNAVQRHIFSEEIAHGWALRMLPFGLQMVAPVIIEFGNDEQRARYLPTILSGEEFWCQGYSEPGAGSDLAALATRAERRDDAYVINGTKTWITAAQWADWIFVLARTDPQAKKQEGISFILADMRTPGISVRPIETIDGGSEINEVHFENVEVPVANLVGREGEGWTYAKFLLEHERTGTAGIALCRQYLDALRELLVRERIDEPRLNERIARVEIELDALAFTELRTLAAESAGTRPGPESSILKIKGTEIQQAISELALDALGPYAERHLAPKYFNYRKTSIYAGSNEIQKNIIAKRILKL
ncbi:acyl-CoA dehydrogenase [Vulcanimicrobium alpinum]|uniref:Acyl-CoA dehydrogenase n=1 Tax=Vulcanimicrobium alpinum TaxID=3016050 RepID=A0AAN1XZP0_UNVUL|nr:acyl-CoA dehydrogenase family protein [Vulcanimicrobium alpinum]BDE07870.1 acyl-CoA dehydrogenase [Vulcanimicrobium alpinum]